MKDRRIDRVLRALEQGPQTTDTLCQPEVGGARFGGRIDDLRKLGYTITSQRLEEDKFLYRLTGRPNTRDDVELTCSRLHTWYGRCRRCPAGYPLIAGAGPNCPVCGREPMAVEANLGPARADVVAAAHDLPAAA